MGRNKKDIQDLKNSLGELFEQIVTLIFPRRCPGCDEVVSYGAYVCPSCKKWFAVIGDSYCLKCGKPLHDIGQQYCKDCEQKAHRFAEGRATFVYKGPIIKSLYRFKYAKRREYAQFYGMATEKKLGKYIASLHADLLVPVPLHAKRMRKRGYNQAEVFARSLSHVCHVPVCTTAVRRVKNTVPQKLLDEQGRQKNLKKAFKIGQNVVKSKVIIVIDDIYTTGSTIDAVAEVLYQAGAKAVYFITIAVGQEV